MSKAYLAGFIAGMNGKGWEDNPFNKENRHGECAIYWRRGCDDGNQTQNGNTIVGSQSIPKG